MEGRLERGEVVLSSPRKGARVAETTSSSLCSDRASFRRDYRAPRTTFFISSVTTNTNLFSRVQGKTRWRDTFGLSPPIHSSVGYEVLPGGLRIVREFP